MRRTYEAAETQESSRSGSWQVGRAGTQRGQATGQPRKWTQGRPGQEPQEENRGPAQRAATTSWASEEAINTVVASIRTRFGEFAIGLGERGIRFAGGR
jgi:hypothetical protein